MTGNEFASLRHELGFSQRDLADVLGLSDSTVPKWEGRKEGRIPAYGAKCIRYYATLIRIQGQAAFALAQVED